MKYLLLGFFILFLSLANAHEQSPETDELRDLAREAYIYGFPMVENYLSIYQFALNTDGSDYKGPPNQIHNVDRVFTPADRGVVTPNSDTPYSFLVMDLRREPLVVSLPEIESDRYYSLQLVDLYSHNVDYIGTRKDGNTGGEYLIAGPSWNGDVPKGIDRVVRMPTALVYSQFRTQLYRSDDLDRVRKIQSEYSVQPLSDFVGQQPPAAAPAVEWPRITRAAAQEDFWQTFNFLLQFAPPLSWEEDLREQFAAIGVAPADSWPAGDISAHTREIVLETGNATHAEIARRLLEEVTSSRGLFGAPEAMRGRYLQRALGAMGGLYGLEEAEALYETYLLDEQGVRLDASTGAYEMRFPKGQLPPAGAFWSVTMYDGERFLVENALDRYLINSLMRERLTADPNGDIVLLLQREKPAAPQINNWLPAPDGEFGVVLRIYLPRESALDGSWKAPTIERYSAKTVAKTGEAMAAGSAHNSRNSLDWAGTYFGILPCADCRGIATRVSLDNDGSYVLERRYLGKSAEPLIDEGGFAWDDSGSVVTLEAKAKVNGETRRGRERDRQFKAAENRLFHLNGDGERVSGDLANAYTLIKQRQDPRIEDRQWMLVEINGRRVEPSNLLKAPFLQLDSSESRIYGNASCNNFFGNYQLLYGNEIRLLENLGATMMACPQMEIENEFFREVRDIQTYSLNEETLELSDGTPDSTLRFKAAD